MSRWFHILLLGLFAALLLPTRATAQKRTAQLSKTTISMNETVTLTLTASGDRLTNYFSPPSSPGVMVLGSSENITTDNSGKTKLRQVMTLQPLQPGTWVLGPFTAPGVSGVITIQPVTLTVTGLAAATSGPANVFLRSDLDRRTALLGQEIIVNVRVYYEEGADFFPGNMPLSSPSYTGFWHERGPDGFGFSDTLIVHNGRRYIGKTLLREFLFATRTGKQTIPAYRYQGFVSTTTNYSGITMQQQIPVTVVSEPVSLQINPLPSKNQPANFGGDIGVYSMRAFIDKSNINAHEAVALTVTLIGEGNLRMCQLGAPILPDSFEVLPVQTTDSTEVTTFGVLSHKTFLWTIIPHQAGAFMLDSITFSFYNTSTGNYTTLTAPPFSLRVDPAPATASSVQDNLGVSGSEPVSATSVWQYLLLLLIPLAALGGLWWWRMRRRDKAETATEHPAKTDGTTTPVALPLDLSALASQLHHVSPDVFVKELYTAYQQALCRKANLPMEEGSINVLRHTFLQHGTTEATCTEVLEPLNQLLLFRFSSASQADCIRWHAECVRRLALID